MGTFSASKINAYITKTETKGCNIVRDIEAVYKGIEESTPTDTIKIKGVVVERGIYGVYISNDVVVSRIEVSDGLTDITVIIPAVDYLKYKKGDVVEVNIQRVIDTEKTMKKLKEIERGNKTGTKQDKSFVSTYIEGIYISQGGVKVVDHIDIELEDEKV